MPSCRDVMVILEDAPLDGSIIRDIQSVASSIDEEEKARNLSVGWVHSIGGCRAKKMSSSCINFVGF
jgi:hypothetical protein